MVAEELTTLFNRNGHQAHHYFALGTYDDSSRIPIYSYRSVAARLFRMIHRLSKVAGLPEIIPIELIFLLYRRRIFQYDIIHFHDICSAISPLTIAFISALKPTVWTFHDCSPFTGGCLYPMDCKRYRKKCGQCPQLGAWPINTRVDLTSVMQAVKKHVINEHDVTITTPSEWMAGMSLDVRPANFNPIVIPNGVNTEQYRLADKMTVRKKHGIPLDRFVVLIIATFLDDERKGIKYAFEALMKIKSLNPYLLLIGNINNSFEQMFKDFDFKSTGYIRGDKDKAEYFSASDIFLFTSLADNMPLVILETMATGTPTVGFRTGGVPEMVQHNQSGYLVNPKDVDSLSEGLFLAYDKTVLQKWGYNARQEVEKKYNYNILYKNHLKLYIEKVNDFAKKRCG